MSTYDEGNKVIQTQRYDMITKKKDLKMKADIRVLRQLCEREPHCLLHTLRNLFLILTALKAAAVRKVLQNASHVKFTFPGIVRTQPLPGVGHCLKRSACLGASSRSRVCRLWKF